MEEVNILELTERYVEYFQEYNYTESRISRYKSLWRNGIIRYMSQRGIFGSKTCELCFKDNTKL